MNNKGNQSNQTRHLTLRIANIKFSILHRPNRKKTSTSVFLNSSNQLPPALKQPQQTQTHSRERVLSRNSFIPSTSIRSQLQVERNRQVINTPLFPADITYSRFPLRRPKSIKPRNYFPVFRQRVVSYTPQRPLHLSQNSLYSGDNETKGKVRNVVHSRMATKSCLVLNHSQKQQNFVRYSHLNSSEDGIEIREREDHLDQTA